MSTQFQFRRGTTSEHASFIGAQGEMTVDTTKKVVVVHDGVTAGGIPMAKASTTLSGYGITDATPINSPALTGSPTAPTATVGTNTTQIATTAFVNGSLGSIDHGLLTGLSDDDHPQYHTDARGDARYMPTGVNAQNGYIILPNGLIFQWGRVDWTAITTSVVFPITFPTAVYNVQLTLQSATSLSENIGVHSYTSTGFSYNSPNNAYDIFWFAVGY